MQFKQKRACIVLVSVSVVVGLLGMASIGLAAGGTWTRKADMPTPGYFPSTCVVDGKIYAIGAGPDPDARACSSTVLVYDPATDTWTKKADMLTARCTMPTSVVDGKIYVIGGTEAAYEPGLSLVEEYDPAKETWTKKADMPTPRAWLSPNGAVVNGKIYIIGGMPTRDGPVLSTVEAYDPAMDTWTTKADMPTLRAYLSTSVVDGKIYAIGGMPGPGVGQLSTVEEYDPATDSWTRKADMPTARAGFSTSAVNGKIYAIGGLADWVPLSTVEEYDPATDSWTRKADMLTARGTLSTSAVNGKIYAIGGWAGPGEPALATVEEYDPGLVPTSVEVTSWGQIKSFFKRLFK